MTPSEQLVALSQAIRNPDDGIVVFLEKICGLPVTKHPGQMQWLTQGKKMINILRPGNRFGKSLIGAGKHLYHHYTKIGISGMYKTVEEWQRIKYDTLNFGPGYEQAREILRLAYDICQGNIHIPIEYQEEYGVTNQSLLKDWFITENHVEDKMLPYLAFLPGGNLFGRSYDEMGAAFKMKALAFITGDEVGDIDQLWSFTNGTLIPRLAQYKNPQIDYYGTPQATGIDYMQMIEMAEEDMAKSDWEEEGFFYVQKGSMFQNPFLDKNTIASIEKIADPAMKRQIIYGEYVETGDKYFGYQRVNNAIDDSLTLMQKGLPGRKYVVTVDFAGGQSAWADYTVIIVIDYTEEPYKVVGFKRFKGGSIPIPVQYKLVEEVKNNFSQGSTCRLIIDSSALGGKNALAFLKHLQPIQFDMVPQKKAEMLATLKIAFDGGQSDTMRRKVAVKAGDPFDENPIWGLIRFPNLPPLVNELTNYKLDDKKIRTDCVMALGVGIHWIEMRRPKQVKNRMVHFDVLGI